VASAPPCVLLIVRSACRGAGNLLRLLHCVLLSLVMRLLSLLRRTVFTNLFAPCRLAFVS
jgi:hypothetical protein